MAAIGSSGWRAGTPQRVLLLWAGAALAVGLSIAVTLGAMRSAGGPPMSSQSAAEEAAVREARIAFFEQRAAADPLDFLALNALAGEYLQRAREAGDVADYERAEAAAERSLELIPDDNFAGLVQLAAVRIVQHNYAAAADLARRAQALKPSSSAPLGLLADAEIGLGSYDEAAQTLDRMRALENGLPVQSRLAHLAFLNGDRFNAVDFWKQAVRSGAGAPLENQAWARVQLGVTYFALGELARAASEHERGLKLFPDYVPALAGLAQVRAAQGRRDEAIVLYRRAVTRQPQPQYVAALGDVLAASGRHAEAEEQYALVEAIAGLYRASGVNTDLQIATFYADHDREPALALEMARAAYEAAPGVYAADALAWALYKNGRYMEADSMSRIAVQQGTLEATFYYRAAMIRRALGDEEGAIQHLERALDLNPHFSPPGAVEARRLLESLQAPR